jgi:magnesium transporter
MITRHERGGVTWIDLEAPTAEELAQVVEEFQIDPRVEEEIVSPTPYPLVIEADSYVCLVLHFPTADPNGGARGQEIDFIVGADFLITCRYEVITSVYNLHRVFESEELLGIGKKKPTTGDLLERIMRQLYAAITDEAEGTSRMLEKIEDDIFGGKERETVLNISAVNRVLLRFDTTLARHREPLNDFLTHLALPHFLGKGFSKHRAHIEAEHEHAARIVSSYREVAAELRDTNDSLLTTAQNEIIKRLTVMAFLTFPLTLVAAIFAMHTKHTPILGHVYDFWIIIGMMTVLGVFLVIFFRKKRWL